MLLAPVRQILLRSLERAAVASKCRRPLCDQPSSDAFNLMGEPLKFVSINPLRRLMVIWNLLNYRSKFDTSFVISEFEDASVKALCVLSKALLQRDYENVATLTSGSGSAALRSSMERVPENKMWLFDIEESDVYFQQLHSARTVISQSGQKILQLLMVYQTFYKRDSFQQDHEDLSISDILPYKCRFVIANLRFVKELQPTYVEDWVVDYANFGQVHPGNPNS